MFRFLMRAHIILAVCLVLALTITVANNAKPSHASGGISGLSVSVGYAEDKHQSSLNPGAFPVPWSGSPNTIFLGNPVFSPGQCGTIPHCYDAGAIRLDNNSSSDIPMQRTNPSPSCRSARSPTRKRCIDGLEMRWISPGPVRWKNHRVFRAIIPIGITSLGRSPKPVSTSVFSERQRR